MFKALRTACRLGSIPPLHSSTVVGLEGFRDISPLIGMISVVCGQSKRVRKENNNIPDVNDLFLNVATRGQTSQQSAVDSFLQSLDSYRMLLLPYDLTSYSLN